MWVLVQESFRYIAVCTGRIEVYGYWYRKGMDNVGAF